MWVGLILDALAVLLCVQGSPTYADVYGLFALFGLSVGLGVWSVVECLLRRDLILGLAGLGFWGTATAVAVIVV